MGGIFDRVDVLVRRGADYGESDDGAIHLLALLVSGHPDVDIRLRLSHRTTPEMTAIL